MRTPHLGRSIFLHAEVKTPSHQPQSCQLPLLLPLPLGPPSSLASLQVGSPQGQLGILLNAPEKVPGCGLGQSPGIAALPLLEVGVGLASADGLSSGSQPIRYQAVLFSLPTSETAPGAPSLTSKGCLSQSSRSHGTMSRATLL